MGTVRILLAVVVGLVSAPLTDLLSVAWMRAAPASLDLTGHYFVSVVLPVVLAIHLVAALALWRVFEPNPTRNPAIYVLSHAVAQAAMLATFANPPADIVTVVAIVVGSGVAVMWVFRRYFWCSHCSATA